MTKQNKSKQKTFEENLLQLVKISPRKPFTSEEVMQILTRYGEPPDWAKQTDEKLIARINEAKTQRLAEAEAHFRDPSQIRSFGELFESTLTIKNIFISQLAQELGMTVEEIEGYVENRQPARALNEAQVKKLAEFTGIAMNEIQRIVNATRKPAGMKMQAANEATTKTASPKSKHLYPTAANYSSALSIREKSSKK